jgi:hypothetical protein
VNELSLNSLGRIAWAAMWWSIALGALWQLARVVL